MTQKSKPEYITTTNFMESVANATSPSGGCDGIFCMRKREAIHITIEPHLISLRVRHQGSCCQNLCACYTFLLARTGLKTIRVWCDPYDPSTDNLSCGCCIFSRCPDSCISLHVSLGLRTNPDGHPKFEVLATMLSLWSVSVHDARSKAF